jgi:glycosyltransferase involved in cell wall biosynthesis
MAAGRPTVISPVGVNVDIVQHGENGLLADTPDEWVNAFEQLAGSRALRQRLAVAGRTTVERGYSAETSAARFAGAIESMFQTGRADRRRSMPADPSVV